MDSDYKVDNGLLYKAVDVWARIEPGRVARYRCFEILPLGRYCVQSKDFYSIPLEPDLIRQLDAQFLQLLSEIPPLERDLTYQTLEEAIRAHDEDFGS